MQPTRFDFVTREEKGKFYDAGGSFHNSIKSYTKRDFLTPERAAKEFGISKERVEKLMRQLYAKNKSFILNGHKSAIVCGVDKSDLTIHPMAVTVFKQLLEKQKD